MRDGAFFASVKLQDLVDPKDPCDVKNGKAKQMKDYLQDQIKEKTQKKKDGDGKFFGMTDAEILLNKETFIQMGLI